MANIQIGKKLVAVRFAIAGAIIPVILMLTKFLELWINRDAVPHSSLYGVYLWPTSLMLTGAVPEWGASSILWLTISILANAVLYLAVGLTINRIVQSIASHLRIP